MPILSNTPLLTPGVFLVAFAAAALPYSGILEPYLTFLPGVLVTPIAAGVAVLGATTALDYFPGVGSFDKTWKERFLLASFTGALASSLLSLPILGDSNRAFDSLAAAVGVMGSYLSPYHVIQ